MKNKKLIEKTFDRNKYNSDYAKQHYKTYVLKTDYGIGDKIDDYCITHDITKSEFMRRAVMSYLDQHLDD